MRKKKLCQILAVVMMGSAGTASALSVNINQLTISGFSFSASGTLNDTQPTPFGSVNSVDPIQGVPWSADAVTFYDTQTVPLVWSGNTAQGNYTYTFQLTAGQVAWGMYMDWNGNNDIPIINTMSPSPGALPGVTDWTGLTMPMATGPFNPALQALQPVNISATASLDGTSQVVPIPSAVLLMGSGLIGFIGFARRRRSDTGSYRWA